MFRRLSQAQRVAHPAAAQDEERGHGVKQPPFSQTCPAPQQATVPSGWGQARAGSPPHGPGGGGVTQAPPSQTCPLPQQATVPSEAVQTPAASPPHGPGGGGGMGKIARMAG